MNGEVIGQQLRQEREAQKISLEQAARATLIRIHYLRALEAGDISGIPSRTQARGFLRTYASYLHLDSDPLIAELDSVEPSDSRQINESSPPQITQQPPDEPGGLYEQSDLIFQEIGGQLQHQRELLGLSLDDVERHTRLRQHYLQALEKGELDRLPSPVQGRGMLNNYATFLGLDPDPILLRFAEGLQARLAVRQNKPAASSKSTVETTENSETERKSSPTGRRLITGDLVFGSAIAIFLVVFAIWGIVRIINLRDTGIIAPTAPPIAEVLLATTTPEFLDTPTPPPSTDVSFSPETTDEGAELLPLPTVVGDNVQVYLTVFQRALLRVVVDGEEQFFERVIPGSAYTFTGKEQIEILTSNGAAVQIFYNGQDQGLMGIFGQVVYQIYTLEGILTPTPTITLTPTPTEIPTSTPQPTSTISPDLPTPPTRPPLP